MDVLKESQEEDDSSSSSSSGGSTSLKDVAEESQQKDDSSSSSSSGGSSSGSSSSQYPKYVEETPFFAVWQDPETGAVKVRNEPEEIDIVYRQYQSSSELKKWEVPDEIVEYWMYDWIFKADAHRYEKETGESFADDLRKNALKALDVLRSLDTPDRAGNKSEIRCPVCDETLKRTDDYELVQGKRICPDHTVHELVENNALVKMSSVETSEERVFPDKSNREWD